MGVPPKVVVCTSRVLCVGLLPGCCSRSNKCSPPIHAVVSRRMGFKADHESVQDSEDARHVISFASTVN